MNPLALLGIGAASVALLGAVGLLVIGLRGRRIDDHPVCRRCRFDLVGVYPGATTCPECGSGLVGERAVRIGQRRRRGGMIACGGSMLLVLLAGGGFVGVKTARGFDWNTIKPAWMLVWEVRQGDHSGRAAAELWARQRMGELHPETLRGLVEPILRRQADTNLPWDPNLADLFVAAWDAGEATDEQALLFTQQGVGVQLAAARKGDDLSVLSSTAALRGGTTPAFFVRLQPVSVTIGDQAVQPAGGFNLAFALQSGLTNTNSIMLPGHGDGGTIAVVWRATAMGRGATRRFQHLGSWEVSATARIPR